MSGPRSFKLGVVQRWGATDCGYGLNGHDECREPATVHVMFLSDLQTTVACEEHMGFIEANADRDFETHSFGANCGMPGALWHHPYEDEGEGYCLFPFLDDASLLMEEPAPALVLTTTDPTTPEEPK